MAAASKSQRRDVTLIQKYINNPLPLLAPSKYRLVGIIGDRPSHYSKSPAMWNAVFERLNLNATYWAFDVDGPKLGALISALKSCDSVLGFNVTVPYKQKVMEFLDALDNDAERIQAVNTVARTPQGRLVGYNTDGQGFIDSILTAQPGNEKSFFQSLAGLDVLLLGAGGSARAVAFHLCDRLQGGQLVIANRTLRHARSLATELENSGARVTAISEEEISMSAPRMSMIINTTIKGQGGTRTLPDGRLTNLEPYSALAPAHAPVFPSSESDNFDFVEKWRGAAQTDIEANHRVSMELAKLIPTNVVFYDLIYHPEETVFLRHGKATGHRTLNGKAMIVCQAVIGCCRILGQRGLGARQTDDDATRRRIAQIMYAAW